MMIICQHRVVQTQVGTPTTKRMSCHRVTIIFLVLFKSLNKFRLPFSQENWDASSTHPWNSKCIAQKLTLLSMEELCKVGVAISCRVFGLVPGTCKNCCRSTYYQSCYSFNLTVMRLMQYKLSFLMSNTIKIMLKMPPEKNVCFFPRNDWILNG